MPVGPVRRAFVDISHGQVHCRLTKPSAWSGTPLLMLHGGPGSSASLLPVMTSLAERGFDLIAPDMMGNGASDPPPLTPDMTFYVDCLCSTLDRLGVERVDCYGHHVGAQIGCEFAIHAPSRVRRLVLDGVGLFTAAQRREFLERYAPPIQPDPGGGHLATLWTFLSATTVRFPHYSEAGRDIIPGGAPAPAAALTDLFAEVARNWRTYDFSYRASFREDLASRLPQVRHPAVVLEVAGDPLARFAARATSLLQDGKLLRIERAKKAEALAHIIDEVTS